MAINSPNDIDDLEGWWDTGSPGLPSTNGAAVEEWQDRSSTTGYTNRDLTTTNSSLSPTWDTTEEAVEFDSDGNAMYRASSASNFGDFCVVMVVKRITPNEGQVWGTWDGSSINDPGCTFLSSTTGGIRFTSDSEVSDATTAVSTSDFEMWIIDVRNSSDEVRFYRDNSLVGSAHSHTLTFNTDDGVILGSNSNPQSMFLRAFLIYKKTLTSQERTDLYDYGDGGTWFGTASSSQDITPNAFEDTTFPSPSLDGGDTGAEGSSPGDIGSCEMWVDINSPNLTQSDGSAVSSWQDRSSLARHLNATSSNLSPTWNDSETAVSFNSEANALYTETGANNYNSWTIAFCVKRVTPTEGVLCAEFNGFDPEVNLLSVTAGAIRTSHNGTAFDANEAISTTDYDLWYIIGDSGADTITFYKNNTQVNSRSGSVVGTADSGFIIGSNTNPQSAFWRGLAVFKKALNSTERQDLYDWADGNWFNFGGGGGGGGDTGSTTGSAPDEIGSVDFWIDYRDLTAFSDGAAIGIWPDRSSVNRDVEETSSSQKPTWDANEEAVFFDGVDDGMHTTIGSATSYNAYTVVFAAKRRTPTQNSVIVSEYNWNWHVSAKDDGATIRHTTSNDLVDSTSGWSSTAYDLWYIVVDAGADTVNFYRNNKAVGGGSRTAFGSVADGGVRIGSNSNTEHMYIRSVVLFKKALSPTERDDLYEYAKTSWLGFTATTLSIQPSHITSKAQVNGPSVFVDGATVVTSPSDIPNLALWVDYRDLQHLSDGSKVSSWGDRASEGRDLTQGSSSSQPEWDYDERAVLFRDSGQYLRNGTSGSSSSDWTFILVVKRVDPHTSGIMWHEDGYRFFGRYTQGDKMVLSGDDEIVSRSSFSSARYDLWLLTVRHSTGTMEIFLNGSHDITQISFTQADRADAGWVLGNASNNESYNIRAFLVYRKALFNMERDFIYDYAIENWMGVGEAADKEISLVDSGLPNFNARVHVPLVQLTGRDEVTADEAPSSTSVFGPTLAVAGVVAPTKSAHSTTLGSTRYGFHDRFIFPVVVTDNTNTFVFYDRDIGTFSRSITSGTYYAHNDHQLHNDGYLSLYIAIKESIESVTNATYFWSSYSIEDSEFENSGLRLTRSSSATFGFLFTSSKFTIDQRLLGMPSKNSNADRWAVNKTELDMSVDYGGVWRSPHRASDKRLISSRQTVKQAAEDRPNPFTLGWDTGERRRFKYSHLRSAHVYEGRSWDEDLAAEAGLVRKGHNAFETLWENGGQIIVVHDDGDSDLGVSNYEIISLDESDADDFGRLIEEVPNGESYHLEFVAYIEKELEQGEFDNIKINDPYAFFQLSYAVYQGQQILFQDPECTVPVTEEGVDTIGGVIDPFTGEIVATQPTASNRPRWDGPSVGATFDGNDYLISTHNYDWISQGGSGASFMSLSLANMPGNEVDFGLMGSAYAVATSTGLFMRIDNRNGSSSGQFRIYENGSARVHCNFTNAITDSDTHTISMVWHAQTDDAFTYVDGSLGDESDYIDTENSETATYQLCVGSLGGGNLGMEGSIRAAAIFKKDVSDEERANIESDLEV